ncbi:hypothetical protein LSH36_471g06005 [Paralvinella palmiformis]|uniref:Abasic site processing protein HMCES n=1 Tax=Paralvinella palmiformis TaxID=53620 RepID=A0AAD9JA72_9ANNE|nr:hypothetical protein LSH36_471g06005 [Paralvinella palmiformis]
MAILDGEQEVRDWLDYGAVSLSKALELIRPQSNIEWHPVSTFVNSTKNNTEQCVKPVDLNSSFMKSWLNKGKKRLTEVDDLKAEDKDQEQDEEKSSPEKKQKLDL